jgi:ABC-type glycerol-3-phosphate transport system substrate-binding protein
MTIRRVIRLGLTLVVCLIALPIAGCLPKGLLAPTQEPVTLRFAYRDGTVELDTLFAAFHEQYPYITVEPVKADRFSNQLYDFVRNGDIDILRDGMEGLGQIENGQIVPLDDIQLEGWSDIKHDYYKGIWDGLVVDGQQWGVPAGLDMMVAYVNSDQAKALKLELPTGNWDMFQFVELANNMNYPEGLPANSSSRLFGFCSDPTTYALDPVIFAYLFGGQIVDDITAPTRATLDDPLTIEAIQWYSDLANRLHVMPDPAEVKRRFARGGVMEAQIRGNCGVWLGMYSNRGGLDTPYPWSSAWQMLPLPAVNEPMSLGEVQAYYITKDCTHPKEALKLLRFLSDYSEACGQMLPPRISQIESDDYEAVVGAEVAAVVRGFEANIMIIPGGISPALERVGETFLRSVIQIVTEDLDAAGVLMEAQDSLGTTLQ